MQKSDGGRRLSLDQSFKCLETAVSDATRTLIRSINTEWQKVEQYRETICIKEDEIVIGKERMQNLKESLYHIEKHLGGTGRRTESLKKSNEELKKNISRFRREEEKVSKECNEEKQKLDDKLKFYENKWQERYEERYANKPLVQEHEMAKKSLEDAKGKLKGLKSELRECQTEIFKAKCERGKRNAEESGFYPLESFIVRIAGVGIELTKLDAEVIEKSKEISRLQYNIHMSKQNLLTQTNTKANIQIGNQRIESFHQNIGDSTINNPEGTFRKSSTKMLPKFERLLVTNGESTRYQNIQMKPESQQLPIAENSTKVPITKNTQQSIQEGKVRSRIEKLKLYTPKLYSPPASQNESFFKQPQVVNNTTRNIPEKPTDNQFNIPSNQGPQTRQIPFKSSFFQNSEVNLTGIETNIETISRKTKVPDMNLFNKSLTSDDRCTLPKASQREHTIPSKYSMASVSRSISENICNEQKEPYENTNVSQIKQVVSSNKTIADNPYSNTDQSHLFNSKKSDTNSNYNKKLLTTYPNMRSGNLVNTHQDMQLSDKENLDEIMPQRKDTQKYVERMQKENTLQQVQKSSMINFNQQIENMNTNHNHVDAQSVDKDNRADPVILVYQNREAKSSSTAYIQEVQNMEIEQIQDTPQTKKELVTVYPNLHSENLMRRQNMQFQDREGENEPMSKVLKCTQGYIERKKDTQKENLLQQVQKASVVKFNREIENTANAYQVNCNNIYKDEQANSLPLINQYQEAEKYLQEQNMDIDQIQETRQTKVNQVQREFKRLKVESVQESNTYIPPQKEVDINCEKTLSQEMLHQGNKQIQENIQYGTEKNITTMEDMEKGSCRSLNKTESIHINDRNYRSPNHTFPNDTATKDKMHYLGDKNDNSESEKQYGDKATVQGLEEISQISNSETNVHDKKDILDNDPTSMSPKPKPLSQKSSSENETKFQYEKTENYGIQDNAMQADTDQSQINPNSNKSTCDSTQFLTARSNGNLSDKIRDNFNSPPKTMEYRTPSDHDSIAENVISPFDFEKHMNALREIKESPHFAYQSRFMYKPPEEETVKSVSTDKKPESFNSISFFREPEEKNGANTKLLEPEKSKEEKSDFLSFAYEDYLADSPSPPNADGKEKPMFGFGADSPKSDVRSPGFFPLFAADTQDANKDAKTGFSLNFGGGDEAKSPDEPSGFKFLF